MSELLRWVMACRGLHVDTLGRLPTTAALETRDGQLEDSPVMLRGGGV